MMQFLVLVAAWEGPNLASDLFAAVGTRVVDLVHEVDQGSLSQKKSIQKN